MRHLSVAVLAAALLGFPASATASVNNNTGFLQVFTNNIENLMTETSEGPADDCKGEWTDLIYYMEQWETPDLFLVQQVNVDQLAELVDKMNNELLPGAPVADQYAGLIATTNISPDSDPLCDAKEFQTNAIIYRKGRLSLLTGSVTTWQPKRDSNGNGTCGVNDALNTASRTLTIAAKFTDRLDTTRTVSAASIHWPIQENGGLPCAADNATRVANELSTLGGSLRIWGGDANVADLDSSNVWRTWYDDTVNGDLGGTLNYRDVIWDHCEESTDGTPSEIKNCTGTVNWTASGPNKRWDFLFARRSSTGLPFIGNEATVTFNQADDAAPQPNNTGLDYSNHRAVHARVWYCTTNSCS